MAITGNQKAYMPALSGIGRSGAIRSGAVGGGVFITIGGVPVGWDRPSSTSPGVIIDSLTITEQLDETPNTCRFRINGYVPPISSEVIIKLGSRNNTERLFAGFALTVTQLYAADNPKNVQADVTAVDYHWLLSFKLVTEQYRSLYASDILANLVALAGAGNGFQYSGQPALPYLDEITYTNEPLGDCITRLMRRVGGYWYCDYHKIIRAFLDEAPGFTGVTPLTSTHPSLADFVHDVEQTQALTRVYVEGRGSRLLSDIKIGETMLPLDTVEMFQPAPDVFLKASFQGSDGGATYLNFSGVQPAGGGALVGPGMGPTEAPVLANASGSGVNTGTHNYAVTFATAAGESLPSPPEAITVSAIPNPGPTVAPVPYSVAVGGTLGPGFYEWGFSYVITGVETTMSPRLAMQFFGGDMVQLQLTTGPAGTTARRLYRTTAQATAAAASTADLRLLTPELFLNNSTTLAWDQYSDSNLTTVAPVIGQRVQLSEIPSGPTGVTARKLYRSAANTTPLKLLATLADNTTTTYLDAIPDGSLGANAPTSDTSGLQQTAGVVLPGDAVPVTSTAAFSPTGGWAIIGNGDQAIRYTAFGDLVFPFGHAMALYGMPSSGPGSITAPIAYNSTVTSPAIVTGITGLTRPLTSGDEIYLVVQVDDAARQAQLAATVNVGDGIREEWVQDRRLSITEARARGQATLNLRNLAQGSIHYTSRDLNTAAGKKVTVNLGPPTNVSGTFRIQQVTISNFRPHLNQLPTYTVTASSSMFNFEDWLRRQESNL